MQTTKLNIDSEGAVLGSLLAMPEKIPTVRVMLKPEHFNDYRHGAIYETMLAMWERQESIDVLTVTQATKGVHGDFLVDLAMKVPTALHVEHYARHVHTEWIERKLRDHYKQFDGDPTNRTIRETVTRLWAERDSLAAPVPSREDVFFNYFQELAERHIPGKIKAFETCFPTLNKLSGLPRVGDLIVFAALTSHGKTAAMLRMALDFIYRGKKVLFMSAEMGTADILDRLVSIKTGHPLWKIRRPFRSEDTAPAMDAFSDVRAWNIDIVFGRVTLPRIEAAVQETKPDVIFVDYLQRVSPEGKEQMNMNRAQFVDTVANDLKSIAMENKALMVSASQFSRNYDGKGEPQLNDLKESSGIEQAADTIILLYRTDDGEIKFKREFDFLVRKCRNGAIGKFQCEFDELTTRYDEMVLQEPA